MCRYEKEPIVIQDLNVLRVSKGYYLFICVRESFNNALNGLLQLSYNLKQYNMVGQLAGTGGQLVTFIRKGK